MRTAGNRDHFYFNLAFELAYFIHAGKEVAFFIAEDALDELPLMLGKQETNRKPASKLSGFWKGGERTRPIRQTVRLNEPQMLQWLCYKESESWERQTERGHGLYSPNEEDMVVRYLAHLLFLTLRQGSFYVSLAIGQLLHQFDRRETRLFYDILTQSDSARMKDTAYIGKQRLQLLKRICDRFEDLIQTTKASGGERQIVAQPVTQWIVNLVNECLQRFTPWDTTCTIESGFDVTDIPALYSSEVDIDEDKIEMDRIHTVVDPACFARFAEGLCQYARMLPEDSQDRGCDFDSPNRRLAVPLFRNIQNGSSRNNRFDPPKLTEEDYVRLERTLDARARRRRSFSPKELSVCVDSREVESIDLGLTNRAEVFVGSEAGVIEVRGRDEQGELTLAILLVEMDEIAEAGGFKDSILDPRGQKITIQLRALRDAIGLIGAQVEVIYAAPRQKFQISKLFKHQHERTAESREKFSLTYARWLTIGAVVLLTLASVFFWFLVLPSRRETQPQEQAGTPPTKNEETSQPAVQQPLVEPSRPSRKEATVIARANWSTDPKTALSAIIIEATRGETKAIDFADRQTRIFLSVPMYDDDRTYTRYRVTLAANGEQLWEQTLRAPAKSITGNDHILSLVLFSTNLDMRRQYALHVSGLSQAGWKALGQLSLIPRAR